MYKGTPRNGGSILLRSYNSRKEPAPEFDCTIWQAGRATSATGLAFKPIQIGQSVFIDEGAGNYNPSPQILDEAVVNEWPGRELGVFISIGTGKRPSGSPGNQHEWWEGFMGGTMGNFAEARKRLVAKIEGCEDTHKYMRDEHLSKRGINPETYYRLNVEVGVGEFGMNEWSRLADISTSTRRYLAKSDVRRMNEEAAAKLAKIERMIRRLAAHSNANGEPDRVLAPSIPPPTVPLAVELPGDEGMSFQNAHPPVQNPRYGQALSPEDKFSVLGPEDFTTPAVAARLRRSGDMPRREEGRLSDSSITSTPRRSHESHGEVGGAPPIPPKTPMQTPISPARPAPFNSSPRMNSKAATRLPYPDDDGPPPVVNMAGKPEFVPR